MGGGEGGVGAAGGADLTRLWAWMTEERRAALPGAGKLTLTPAVRKTLRALLGEHGEADLRAAWVWMLRSNHPRAVYLRAGGYAHPSTFLRPGNCGTYLDLARESGQNPVQAAPGAANGTGAGGQATPEAERAWEVVQSAALDTRYHAQCPPPAFSRDPDRDRRVRLALRRIGGWPALVSDIHDHWRAKDMRAAFVAAYAMEAA